MDTLGVRTYSRVHTSSPPSMYCNLHVCSLCWCLLFVCRRLPVGNGSIGTAQRMFQGFWNVGGVLVGLQGRICTLVECLRVSLTATSQRSLLCLTPSSPCHQLNHRVVSEAQTGDHTNTLARPAEEPAWRGGQCPDPNNHQQPATAA